MSRRTVFFVGLLALVTGQVAAVAAEGIRVEGRVLVSNGAPLPQAEVTLRPLRDTWAAAGARLAGEPVAEPAARTLTNAEGRFRLDAPAAGLWTVRVEARGFVPLETRLRPLIEPVVLEDARAEADAGVRFEITDGKAPLAGARVVVRSDLSKFDRFRGAWFAPRREGTTDAKGQLILPRGDSERLEVAASVPGRVVAERGGVGATAKLALAAGVERKLSVRGSDGQPIAQALVAVGKNAHPYVTTDAAGAARVSVPATGETELNLVAGDGRRLETRIDAGPVEKREEPVVLAIADRVAVVGRLIDAESRRAIAGGLVWDGEEPLDSSTTDASGGFVLRGPAGARMRLAAGATGYLRGASEEIQLEGDGRIGPTLALAPAAAVEGQVLDARDQPIAGAEVTVFTRPAHGEMRIEFGAPTAKPRNLTDQNGRYRLGPLDPDGRHAVRVSAVGFAPAEQPLSGLEPYRTKTGVNVTLTEGQVVSGRVIDSAAKPLREVSIALKPASEAGGMGMMRMMQAGPEAAYEGTTDDTGRFRIAGVPKGRFDLVAHRRGFAKTKLAGLEIAGAGDPTNAGDITLVPGERVTGVVTNRAGEPIEGVEVRVQATSGPMMVMMGHGPDSETAPDAITDPSGWFVIEDLSPDEKLSVGYERAGYVGASTKGISLPRPEPIDVVMGPASDVAGTVTTAEGEPIAGAQVQLERRETREMGGNVMMMVMVESDTTDALGHFRFEDQKPGQIGLKALASGYQEAKRDNVDVPEGQDLEGLEMSLPAGAVVVGQVLGPDRRPLIGADVSKIGGQASPMRMMEGTSTDGDGRYRLEGLAPGAVSIEANHEEWPRTVRDVELDAGINTVNLQFEGGQPVSGRVADASGNGVPEANVRLVAAGRFWGGGPGTRTRADGTFEIPGVSDGEYRMIVEAEGYASTQREEAVSVAGSPLGGVDVTLDRGATISGRVLGLEPDAYAGVRVRAEGVGAPFFDGAQVDRQGNYRLEHVRPGTYQVIATLADSGRAATGNVTLEPGQVETRVDLQFESGLTLEGVVLQGDAPVAGLNVFAEALSHAHTGWSDTDSEGRFSIEGLEAGSYRVNVRDWTSGLAYEEPLELSASRDIRLELPTAYVAGRVVDATDGEPLAGVTLTLVPDDPSRQGRLPSHAAATDMDGRFRIASIGDGSWRLTANKDGYAAAARALQVQFDEPADDLEVSMEATEGLELEARLPTGQPPPELQVAVVDASGGTLVTGNFPTGEGGRVRLANVPAGTWDVIVGAVGSAVSSVRATAPGRSVPVSLVLPTRLKVSVPELAQPGSKAFVRLADSSGQPFRALSWSGRPVSEWAMTGGVVELATLPPGSWKVTVATADGRQWTGQSQTSPGQVAELRLE